jgi:23S rRNA pseudouridine1911/1915/1917 synthase
MNEQQLERLLRFRVKVGGERLDLFLAENAADLSRSRIQKLIEEGAVQVNDRLCFNKHYRVQEEDLITCRIPKPQELKTDPEAIPLKILFEDQDLLVIDKPLGMVVHPAPGHSGGTLVNALLHHCQDLSGIGGVTRPGIVHRLDKDTSGLLIVAKNDYAHNNLAVQLKARLIQRHYLALVCGRVVPRVGRIEAPVGRDPRNRKKMAVVDGGRQAVSRYRVLKEYQYCSLLKLKLETGRTHQIRVHLSHLGFPVIGDYLYGPGNCAGLPDELLFNHALHAYRLSFLHPSSKEQLMFSASPPSEFQALLHYLAKINK